METVFLSFGSQSIHPLRDRTAVFIPGQPEVFLVRRQFEGANVRLVDESGHRHNDCCIKLYFRLEELLADPTHHHECRWLGWHLAILRAASI